MYYQKFISLLLNKDLQQEIEDNEKLQLENCQKIINIIGVEVWNNSSANALLTYKNRVVRKLKSEDSKLTKIYIWLEDEVDRRMNNKV